MTVEFVISELIPASPAVLYNAWLDSESHTLMTGGKAKTSHLVKGEFQAWDGYIWGKNLELDPPHRIVQNWRTQDFLDRDPDSMIEITFLLQGDQTLISIKHTMLPTDGMKYKQGWIDSYFTPIKAYFSH